MTLDATACHGRPTFDGRPPAGTDPWDWWWSTWSKRVVRYTGDPGGGRWALTRWTAEGPTITFDYRLTGRQLRVALAHELHHLAIGGVCSSCCVRVRGGCCPTSSTWPSVSVTARRRRSHGTCSSTAR